MAQSEEKQTSDASPKYPEHITSQITYNNDTGKRYRIEMPNDKKPGGTFIMSSKTMATKVLNGRNAGCMLLSHGFQLIDQQTTLSTSDFYQNPDDIIRKTYYKEMADAITKMTGASFVKIFHHQVGNETML